MKRIRITPMRVGYVLAAVVLIANTAITFLNISTLIASVKLVDKTGEAIYELEQVTTILVNAETGERGYLVMGDESYLSSYWEARPDLERCFNRLAALTSDEHSQFEKVVELRAKAFELMSEFEKTIGLRRSEGLSAAAAAMRIGRGKRLMDEVRERSQRLHNDLDDIIEAQTNANRAIIRRTAVAFGAASALALLLLAFSYVLTSRDIAARERVEREVRAASRAKSEFLANMSHEIRTPMNGIIGLSDLAVDAGSPPAVTEYVEMIRSSSRSLLAIVNDILDFSKVEAGKLDLRPAPFDLRRCLESVMVPMSVRAEEKGIGVSLHLDGSLPQRLVGDEGRLRQVLINLVGNAVKFTDRGRVDVIVEAAPQPQSQDDRRINFVVSDTGPGIGPEKHTAIFQPFVQGDGSASRLHGGTGLGLAIAEQLVRLMGGQIEVESEPGRGSKFRFTLSLPIVKMETDSESAEPTPSAVGVRPSGHPLRILVVEDNPINQVITARLLEKAGHTATVAGDGRAALAALDAHRFDLVLMDIQMPEMDGFETLAQIRRLEDGGDEHLPIVALTAHAMKGDRERCLEAGFDDYVAKPIGVEELGEFLERFEASEAGRRAVERSV